VPCSRCRLAIVPVGPSQLCRCLPPCHTAGFQSSESRPVPVKIWSGSTIRLEPAVGSCLPARGKRRSHATPPDECLTKPPADPSSCHQPRGVLSALCKHTLEMALLLYWGLVTVSSNGQRYSTRDSHTHNENSTKTDYRNSENSTKTDYRNSENSTKTNYTNSEDSTHNQHDSRKPRSHALQQSSIPYTPATPQQNSRAPPLHKGSSAQTLMLAVSRTDSTMTEPSPKQRVRVPTPWYVYATRSVPADNSQRETIRNQGQKRTALRHQSVASPANDRLRLCEDYRKVVGHTPRSRSCVVVATTRLEAPQGLNWGKAPKRHQLASKERGTT